jgi:dimethylargininase
MAIRQHEAYCEALEQCGVETLVLDADARFPDSTFVEDTAVLTERVAIPSRPGAPSRQGEVASVADALADYFDEFVTIREPGTLDGGDVCRVADHFLVGVSRRTNEAGAGQLCEALARYGYGSSLVDIRGLRGLLHLKSGIASAGDNLVVVAGGLADHPALREFETLVVDPAEAYAANCVLVNDYLLMAAGFPRIAAELRRRGHDLITLEMSEFRKMDGGLSCLSLRF